MPISLNGLGICMIAVFGWGTALVPLKFERNKQNGVAIVTIALSGGYLVASAVVAVVLAAMGESVWANSGLIGGAIWGTGKVLNILAVTGAAGLAAGQAVQCSVNIGVAYLIGVALRGEPCTSLGATGVAVLAAGLVAIVTPCPRRCRTTSPHPPIKLEEGTSAADGAANDAAAHGAQQLLLTSNAPAPPPLLAHAISLALAACSGTAFGFQSVPLLYDASHPSSMAYSTTQAVAQFGLILLTCAPCAAYVHRRACRAAPANAPRPPLVPHPRALLLAAGGGALLFSAAASINSAVRLLGVSIAQPLGNTNMVVAATWGTCLLGEVPETRERVRLFCGCAVAIGGAVLLALS